jgi:dTDP-4-dehydrorhamnose 3,5-epimerase
VHARDVSPAWLRSINYTIKSPFAPPSIDGVVLRDLTPMVDGRGDVTELWSLPWVEAAGFVAPRHCYQSATDAGVIKCWHLHESHTDQFAVTRGKLQVLLVDVREEAPTFGHVDQVYMGTQRPRLLKIPPRVLHGWKALSEPEVIVVNLQSHVYDPTDEFKLPWDCILKDVWEPRFG